jgi:hypothetical protein
MPNPVDLNSGPGGFGSGDGDMGFNGEVGWPPQYPFAYLTGTRLDLQWAVALCGGTEINGNRPSFAKVPRISAEMWIKQEKSCRKPSRVKPLKSCYKTVIFFGSCARVFVL